MDRTGDNHRVRQAIVRQQHGKLFAADAANAGAGRAVRLNARHQPANHLIAHRMAVFVIDLLEVVDIQNDQRRRAALQRLADALNNRAAIPHRRQRIVAGFVLQLLRQLV